MYSVEVPKGLDDRGQAAILGFNVIGPPTRTSGIRYPPVVGDVGTDDVLFCAGEVAGGAVLCSERAGQSCLQSVQWSGARASVFGLVFMLILPLVLGRLSCCFSECS